MCGSERLLSCCFPLAAASIEVQSYKNALVLANKQLKSKPDHYIVVVSDPCRAVLLPRVYTG